MGLVAAGLALIIDRIALEKPNEWLSSANLLTLSATLYGCSFINFAALLANYNVDHSLEMNGKGISLDLAYLRSLGPGAFPALDRFFEHQARSIPADTSSVSAFPDLVDRHEGDKAAYRIVQNNWRAWSFRNWRLNGYLDIHGPFVVPARFDLSGL